MSSPTTRSPAEAQEGLAAALERTQHELALSEARFRNVIERNADAVVVIDTDGIVRFANRMAERLFTTRRAQLVGTPFGFPLLAGETTELDLVRNGDPPLTVEMRVVQSDWEGEPAHLATLRDITERKRAERDARRLIHEQAARESAEGAVRRLRFLAESSTVLASSLDHASTLSTLAQLCVDEIADWVVVYVVEEDGVVRRLEVSHCDPARSEAVQRLHDVPIDPDVGHPVFQVIERRESLVANHVDDDLLAGITMDRRHFELVRELGMSAFMMVPLIARDRVVGAIALVRAEAGRRFDRNTVELAEDLAFRAALAVDNARLFRHAEEANRSKSDFLAMISHDLRTPLGAIMGFTDLLLMGVPEPLGSGSTRQVERIRSAAGHLLALIEQLLSVARLDGGHDTLELSPVDVTALAEEVVGMVEPLAASKPVEVSLRHPGAPVVVHTDAAKLRQVLTNLAANAVKYTERGRVELVLTATPEGGAVLEVTDTGVGISPEHLERIFEPFWQVDGHGGAEGGSTGLGLSVVRRLVDLLGGEIAVASEEGTGSTFTIQLPAMVAQVPAGSDDVTLAAD